ncbi:MAG: tRNA glutamyl-Q(34) synthetase GluQRS [Rhizobiales bacterium]|nr:tRNA glutamyl-Q(34) synthetase GluQRS [Hyphomicrobiales bacterium]OJY03687.1 MAG: tRNA glutamyl-Q(34) synthetase GluQRS [Rhizobiales bacterium 63-22]
MPQPVFRFAPSPNGQLHLGHAFSALVNERMARESGGRLLLRMEDIDTARCTPQLEQGIYDDLRWLGLAWEQPVRRQSEHFGDYRNALTQLAGRGLVYPAFLSRGEVRARIDEAKARGENWPSDPDGAPLYPTGERGLTDAERLERISSGLPYAWRLDMERALAAAGEPLTWRESGAGPAGQTGLIAADPSRWGDVVIARKDTPTSYHLSVVVDDALQGVTHVVRGRDLFHATAVHRLLQKLLGLPEPLYHHHDLLLGEDGLKLSKSRRDTALAALRERGWTPHDIRTRLGF